MAIDKITVDLRKIIDLDNLLREIFNPVEGVVTLCYILGAWAEAQGWTDEQMLETFQKNVANGRERIKYIREVKKAEAEGQSLTKH